MLMIILNRKINPQSGLGWRTIQKFKPGLE